MTEEDQENLTFLDLVMNLQNVCKRSRGAQQNNETKNYRKGVQWHGDSNTGLQQVEQLSIRDDGQPRFRYVPSTP